MATLIDAFVLQIGFDTSGLESQRRRIDSEFNEIKRSAGGLGQTIEQESKRAANFFGNIKNEALALLGVLTGTAGLGAAVRSFTNDIAGIKYAATDLGMDPRELQIFALAMQREVHGSTEKSVAQLKKLQSELQQWKTYGDSSIASSGRQIGVNPETMGPLDVIRHAARWNENSKDDAARKRQILQGLGFDDDTIHFIQRGSAAVNKALDDAAPDALTDKQIDRLSALQRRYDEVSTAIKGLFQKIVAEDIAPWLTPLLTRITELVHEFEAFKEKNPEYVRNIEAIGFALTAWLGARAALGIFAVAFRMNALTAAMLAMATAAALLAPAIKSASFDDLLGKLPKAGEIPQPDAPGEGSNATTGFRGWLNRILPASITGAGLTEDERTAIARALQPIFNRRHGGGGGSSDPAGDSTTADTDMTPAKRALLDAIAVGESGGADPYHQSNTAGSGAYGRYQWKTDTWREVAAKTGFADIQNPVHQDRNAWFLAQQEYRRRYNRDLEADINSGGHEDDIAAALRGRWPSLPGGSQPGRNTADVWRRNLNRRVTPLPDPRAKDSGANADAAAHDAVQPPPLPRDSPNPMERLPPRASFNGGDQRFAYSFDQIHVHTQATDASGIGRDIHQALENEIMTREAA